MREFPAEMRRLQRLLETAEFDHGQDAPTEPFALDGGKADAETTDKGRAATVTRYTSARSGDNALRDLLDEDAEGGVVDRLEVMLRKAGIGDDEMRAGIALTPAGQQKAAARLGIGADEVPLLLDSLATKLSDAAAQDDRAYESAYATAMAEADERYGYEKDGMGSVTVRDATTGKETYLQGSQAADLLTRLQQHPDATQAILSTLAPLLEVAAPSGDALDAPSPAEIALRRKILRRGPGRRSEAPAAPVDEAEDGSYLAEMRHDQGSFNFAWKESGTHGTGTAGYQFDGGKIKIKLLGVRDASGEPLRPDPGLRRKLERVAHEYVQDEAV